MEFFQEGIIRNRLPPSQKRSTPYLNLFRAISCLEQKLSSPSSGSEEDDDDNTQEFCELAN